MNIDPVSYDRFILVFSPFIEDHDAIDYFISKLYFHPPTFFIHYSQLAVAVPVQQMKTDIRLKQETFWRSILCVRLKILYFLKPILDYKV